MENINFVGICAAFWGIFLRKISSQITCANHMTMTTGGQFSHGLITVRQKKIWT